MSAGFYGGGGGRIANATVLVTPNLTGFQAQLQASINKAFAGLQIPQVGAAGLGGAAGIKQATDQSNLLRGSLIGLSRVTPVTVFGLGAYGTAAIAAGYAIKSSIRATADFEHQLFVFQATTNATADQMDQIAEKAKELGNDLSLPSTSAGDAARAMTELAKAGLSVEDTLAGSTGVLQLAAAAQLDVASAATFVATQLNAFGLAGTEATHIADLLSGASIAAQGDIRDFGTAFQQVSAVSRQVGLSVETTTGALTGLAKAGLRGADGGTSLRTTLLRLAPTTKQAAEFQKALGIEIDKNVTIGEQLPDLLDQYRASLSALTPVQQQQALAQIFGQDAIRAASILIREGSEGLRDNTAAADQNGAAARLAAANAKGLSGAFNGLKSNLDTLGITLGAFVSGPLEDMTRGLAEAVTGVTDLITAVAGINLPGGLLGDRIEGAGKTALGKYFKFLALGPAGFALSELGRNGDPSALLPETGLSQPGLTNTGAGRRIPRGPGQGFGPGAQFLTPAERARIQANIRALEEDKKKRKPLPGDTNAPNKLQISQLNAQLNEDLQAELTADKAIEAYFHERLNLAKKGTDRYTNILAAEASAHAASESVQTQIQSNADRAAAEAKRLRDERLAQQKKEAAEAAQAAKDLFNLQKSRLDLRIDAAGLTEGIGDDIRANRAEIRFYNAQIKRIEALRKRRKLTIEEQQAVVDYRTAIIGLRATIKSLKDGDKDSRFSLNDLFQEAVNQFNEFGSNVSQSPGTPGSARGALAAGILAQKPGITKADELKLREAATTNSLLAQILTAIYGAGLGGNPYPFTPNQASKQHPGGTAFEKARSLGATVRAF